MANWRLTLGDGGALRLDDTGDRCVLVFDYFHPDHGPASVSMILTAGERAALAAALGASPTAPVSRADLVTFVRAVLPELDRARAEPGVFCLRIGPTTRSLSLRFMLENREQVGEYLVPLPEAIAALAHDEARNPWGQLEVRMDQSNAATDLELTPAPPRGSGVSERRWTEPATGG